MTHGDSASSLRAGGCGPSSGRCGPCPLADERAYINNFYKNYYRPDRVLVLEVEGAVRAMHRLDSAPC